MEQADAYAWANCFHCYAAMGTGQNLGRLVLGKLKLSCRQNESIELSCDDPPLLATFTADEGGRLFDVLSAASIRFVLVHQLLGYPHEFIARFIDWARDRRVIYFTHDFYPLCPRVTMIDAVGR